MSLRLECTKRNYELERIKANVRVKHIALRDDPLSQITTNNVEIEKFENENFGKDDEDNVPDDKAGTTITHKLGQHDPLADFHKLENLMLNRTEFETWEAKKLKIFATFKTMTDGQEIIIDERKDRDTDRVIRYGKGKSRMDQLEIKSKGASSNKGVQMISAQEFTNQLERLQKELHKFWDKDDKVACIRIAIQCAKLLNDVASPVFYPQKFILLTDILDTFGQLVLGRMKKLTKHHSGGKINIDDDDLNIDYSLIPDKVQEICMNWFLKSACIREVLPRIYLELALVSCHKFMQRRVQQSDLLRLSKMVRGIAEPLCATYTAAYLARVGHSINPEAKDYLMILTEFSFLITAKAIKEGNSKCASDEQYFSLFEPAIDWLFQCLATGSNKKIFAEVFDLYEKSEKKKAIFLESIMRYFPSEIIASATTTMIMCIKDHYTEEKDKLRLIKELGLTLLKTPPKKNQPKLDYLNYGWEVMKQSQDAHMFLETAIVLVDFSIKNLNSSSVNVFIKEIFKKLQEFALSAGSGDSLYMKLEYLLVKVMLTAKDFSELIGFENLLGLLNYFPTSVKNKLCEMMLNFFV